MVAILESNEDKSENCRELALNDSIFIHFSAMNPQTLRTTLMDESSVKEMQLLTPLELYGKHLHRGVMLTVSVRDDLKGWMAVSVQCLDNAV